MTRGQDGRASVWITILLGTAAARRPWLLELACPEPRGHRGGRIATDAVGRPAIGRWPERALRALRRGKPAGADPCAALLPARRRWRPGRWFAREWTRSTAALVAGRFLSVLGLLATTWMASRLSRLDGAPRKAGWWTVLLILSAPILSGFPFAVRPDMVGIALQTAGIFLVLSALQAKRPEAAKLLWAYTAFGLAVCVKQHDVGAAAISTGLLLSAWLRGRLRFHWIVSSLLVASSIVLLDYGAEEFVTNGRMSQAVLVAAANVGRIHPADWVHVRIVAVASLGRTIGLIALLTAAHLAVTGSRLGLGRRVFAMGGAVLVGLLVGLWTLQLALIVKASVAEPSHQLVDLIPTVGSLNLVLGFVMTILILPACALFEWRSYPGERLGSALVAYVAAELFLMTALWRFSAGAWANYAIEAVVLASVLTGRAVARACDEARSRRLVVLAASAVLVGAILHIQEVEAPRYLDRLELTEVFDRIKRAPSEFFFVDRPEQNRADGRLELVYDDWLYPVFESMGQAEPRSNWLLGILTSSSIRVVVTTSNDLRVPGIEESLPRLRFRPAMRVGNFFVWVREPLGTK